MTTDEPDLLTPEQRELARSLRQAARIIGHAALPAEYRAPAFVVLAPIIVAGARRNGEPQPAPPGRSRSW